MAELSSWPTQNSGPTGTIDSREAATHIGGLVYPHTSALKAKSGFRPGPGSSPGIVTASGTPDAFVHVAPFQLLLQNIRGSGLGTYIAALDVIKDINILSTAADPTNPRDDLIVAQQSDLFDADANSDFLVRHVVGTPAPVPSDPAISGSTNVVALARVRVGAGVISINSGNITDLRTTGHAKSLSGGLHTVALGGLLPVASQAERDALTGTYNGMQVWRTDLKAINIHDGTSWLDRPGGPLIKRHRRTTDSPTSTGSIVGCIRLDSIPILSGHLYRVVCPNLSLTSNAGDAVQLTLRASTSGNAGTGDTAFATADRVIPSVSVFDSLDLEGEYVAGANGTLSVILCLIRASGGGISKISGSLTKPIDMKVYFDGKDPGSSGVDL